MFSYEARVLMAEAQRADRMREAAAYRLAEQAKASAQPARRSERPSVWRVLATLPAILRPRKLA